MPIKETTKKELSRNLKRLVALVLMGVIGASSVFSVAALSRMVCIVDGDDTYQITTLNTDTSEILQRANLEIGKDDLVIRDEENPQYLLITIKRAFNLSLTADGVTQSATFTGGTVKDALREMDVTLDGDDMVTPSLDTGLSKGMTVEVTRYHNVTVHVDGESKTITAPEGTVGDTLKNAGITMSETDAADVSLEKEIADGMEITIDRVEYKEVKKTEKIPYKTITKKTAKLYQGETEVQQKGVTGEREITLRQKIVNGEVVETEQIKNTVKKEAVNLIKLVGTKSRPVSSSRPKGYAVVGKNGTFVDHNGKTIAYKKMLTGSCTAYTAPAGASTSTGRPAKFGNVAVNPNIIPYGTKLYICSTDGSYVYGYAVAADTGGALMSGLGLVDLYFNSLSECYSFGRRNMAVYFLS